MLVEILIKLLTLGLLGLLVYLIVTGIKKEISSIKVMLLGINLTLFGGIIAVDPHSTLGGIGYLIAFIGLIISAKCLGRNN